MRALRERSDLGRVEMVRRGYDAAAELYVAERDQLENLDISKRSRTCSLPVSWTWAVGLASPIDRCFVDSGYDVIGFDGSSRQLELAKAAVPEARFELMNMLELSPGQYEVDGIVSFDAIFHTPRHRHVDLLKTLASFLRSDGVMMITMGASEHQGAERDLLGVEMYWSPFGPQRNRELVEAAGLTVVADETRTVGHESHQILIARS